MDNVSEDLLARTMNLGARSISDAGRTGCVRGRADTAAYNPRLAGGSQGISPEERWQAIAVMAYHLAGTHGFAGGTVKYWLAAQAKVDAELALHQSAM